ncbi:MAG: MAPEG family protein [Rhodomicrobium sp.]
MPHFTAIATLLALGFYFFTGLAVGKARVKFGVKAPATVGHPEFERLFRIQMNTLEWLPLFLPTLWLFAIYVNDIAAAAIGLVWIFGRILYYRGYAAAAEKRERGFGIQAIAAGVLFVGAFAGVAAKIAALHPKSGS